MLRNMRTGTHFFLFAVFMLLTAIAPVIALEQISNGNFSAALADPPWFADNQIDQPNALSNLDINAGSFRGRYQRAAGGGANPLYYADGLLEQTFPSVANASDSIASISVSYFEDAKNADGDWLLNLSGTIRRNDSPTTILDTFLNRQIILDAGLQNPAWGQVSAYTMTIPGGYRYRMRFYWTIACLMNTWAEARIDNVKCNLSPSGLVASETAAGACALNWADSTGVTTLSQYRIYRRTSESDPWGAHIDTSATSDYVDNTLAASVDTAFYAVTDVDTTGAESPKSPIATFKRAKIVISSVSATPTTVTIGQNGIPVHVTVTNTGSSTARLDSIELTNDPAVGVYNVALQTSLPITLAGGESQILTFSVDILDDSDPETDTLDAGATGTSLVTGVILSAPSALTTHQWLIRAPANLVVQTITAPTTVYRDQKLVTVVVEVLNDGAKNAAAYWESVELMFSNGSYLNIANIVPMPVTVYAGQTASVTLNLDVSPTSATGTCIIDANITFRDVNLLINSANYDGAVVPGQWTVVAGLMKTYKGPPAYPSYTITATSFNQADGKVYARAENLIPLEEYRFRWYYPNGSVARTMDPPKTTDATGKMTDELVLTPAAATGTWRVIATRVTSTIALAETYFYVVKPASLSITIGLPPTVTINQTFNATMTAINAGGAAIDDTTPDALTAAAGNTGTASKLSGPAPLTQIVAGGNQGYFSWQFQADSLGSFTVDSGASGYDANDSTLLAATAQSNMCMIQSKPVLSVVSITEGYTNVYRNQTGLTVSMLVRNQGEAAVAIDAAALVFSFGDHSQVIASPTTLPTVLPGNSDITIVFTVAVAAGSPTGAVSITGSFTAHETNDPTATYAIAGGAAGAWTINAFSGKCAANSNYSPEQYTFNQSQRIFVEFTGATNGNTYKIYFYDAEVGGTLRGESGIITAAGGTVACQYDIPAAGALTRWRTEIWKVASPSGNRQGVVLGEQFFQVQTLGTLTTSLQITPATGVELGENITVTMSLSNIVANSSTIYPATAATPIRAAGFTGNATLVSGPEPASVSVSYGFPATFTWVFQTTQETNVASTFALIATATGIDLNTTEAVTVRSVSSSATSNGIPIILRDLDFTPDPLSIGNLACGSTYSSNFTLENTGNVALTSVVWQKAYPVSSAGYSIPYSYFSFSPSSGFSTPAGGNQAGSFTITLPYNQPPGTYTALMAVFDDLNTNSVRDLGEAYQEFTVTLVASDCKVVMVNDDPIDLGGWPANSQTATLTFSVSNIGNRSLEDLVFSQVSGTFVDSTITVTPASAGGLATDAVLTAEISAWVGAEAAGNYLATWTIEDLTGTYASDTFQVKFSVGAKDFTFSADPYDIGDATPTYTLGNLPVEITNTGLLPLTLLTADPRDLGQSSSTSVIPFENILFEMPTGTLAVGDTAIGTLSVYVPAGTPLGIFEGDQYFFDDEDGDGLWNGLANEAQRSFLLRVNVVEHYGVQVIDSTLDFGGVTQGETKTVNLLCRNIGNVDLDLLFWEKYRMLSGANEILASGYSIYPETFFTIPAGEIFYANASITIDMAQATGLYSGENFNWLFNDKEAPIGRNASEPQSSFAVSCQVGSKVITILEAGPLVVTGLPSLQTAEISYSVKNEGTLVLATPKMAAITQLDEVGLLYSIPASAVTFNPELFDYINPGQIKAGKWSVLVPPGQNVGTYTGTIQVWDDSDNSGAQNGAEPFDNVDIEVRVLPKRILTITPSPLDLNFVPPGQNVNRDFQITNAGNVDITGGAEVIKAIIGQLNSISPGPPAITQVEILPLPDISNNLLIGGSVTAAASVTVPANQTSGPYEGTQKIYIDKGSPGDGIHDSASEEYATFTLKLTVGQKKLSITPATLDMGNLDPLGNNSLNYTIKNESSIPLSSVKFYKLELATDSETIATTTYSFSPAGPFTVSSNGSKAGTASLTVPMSQPAGVYQALLTVFEDDSGEGAIGTFEASATFLLRVTVNAVPRLTFTPGSVDFGTIDAGSLSSDFDIEYSNSGNVALSGITWATSPLTITSGTGETISEILFSGPAPSALAIGASGTAQLKIGPIPGNQKPGIYTGSIDALYNTTTPFIPPARLFLTVEVSGSAGPDLASGSAYQEIATTTWAPATDPVESWLMSVWVSLDANASASVALLEVNSAGEKKWRGILIDSSGNLVASGTTGSGIAMTSRVNIPPRTWHRVYFSFDYNFDINTASNTYIVLQNTTENTLASQSVWFDGVQLERAGPEQTRPSPYTPGSILVSPNKMPSLDGKHRYYEW